MEWDNNFIFDLSHPALLAVGMQNDFCREDWVYHQNDPQTFQVDGIKEINSQTPALSIPGEKERDSSHLYQVPQPVFLDTHRGIFMPM